MPLWRNYNEKEIIKINIEESFNELLDESEAEFFKELNKELGKRLGKEPNKESNKESSKESNKESDKESDKEPAKETSDEELIEIVNLRKDENTTDCYDKNKFKIILTTIDSNNFHHKNKDLTTFNGINNLINNIKNNTISEALAKQKLDALNEIKKAEIKN